MKQGVREVTERDQRFSWKALTLTLAWLSSWFIPAETSLIALSANIMEIDITRVKYVVTMDTTVFRNQISWT